MNGSYKLMLDWGLKPSMFTMIDGRKFNERFVYEVPGMTDDCQYFIRLPVLHIKPLSPKGF
jgi:hypothetical protein